MATLEEYKAAMNELAQASAAFKRHSHFINSLAGAAHHNMQSFVRVNFGMKDASSRGVSHLDQRHRFDFSNWPSGEEVRKAGVRVAEAFNATHAIYKALPAEDREYIKAPPHQPDI